MLSSRKQTKVVMNINIIKISAHKLVDSGIAFRLLSEGIKKNDRKKCTYALLALAFYFKEKRLDYTTSVESVSLTSQIENILSQANDLFITRTAIDVLKIIGEGRVEVNVGVLALKFLKNALSRTQLPFLYSLLGEIVKPDISERRSILRLISSPEFYKLLELDREYISLNVFHLSKSLLQLWRTDSESWIRLFYYSVNSKAFLLLAGFSDQLRNMGKCELQKLLESLDEPYRHVVENIVNEHIVTSPIYMSREFFSRFIAPNLVRYIKDAGKSYDIVDVSFARDLSLELKHHVEVVFTKNYLISTGGTHIGNIVHRELPPIQRFGRNLSSIITKDPVLGEYGLTTRIILDDLNTVKVGIRGEKTIVSIENDKSSVVFSGTITINLFFDKEKFIEATKPEVLEKMFALDSSDEEQKRVFEKIKRNAVVFKKEDGEFWSIHQNFISRTIDPASYVREWISFLRYITNMGKQVFFNAKVGNFSRYIYLEIKEKSIP